jgi:hypothetical protein
MGFRLRKSFTLLPGVRMTVSPRGVSTSVGVRGARVSVHSSGRVTRSVSIPGSGISYTTTSRSGRPVRPELARSVAPRRVNPSPAAGPTVRPPAPARPGLFAPKWEKLLYDAAVKRSDAAAVRQVATDHPAARQVGALVEVLLGALPIGDFETVRHNLAWLMSTAFDPCTDPFLTKYLPGSTVTLEVAAGIVFELPMSRAALGLTLAEAHQSAGDLEAAVDVVEHLTPTTASAVSLAELYADQHRWADVIDLTNGVTNDDEAGMFLLIQRARALRESGTPGAARQALKEALRLRSRPAGLRHRALIERAYAYLAERKPAMARKDLERVLADDAGYPGLQQALADLPAR